MKTQFSFHKSIALILAVFAVCLISATSEAQSRRILTDRARVKVVSVADAMGGPNLKVVRTDSDSPLRAGTAWLWSKQWFEEPADYYAAMRGKGLNAVRIVLFDTWEKEAGYGTTDWNDPTYRNVALGRIERAINFCSQNGLYAIINSHNKIPQFDVPYNKALWTYIAPHFRNRTHVVYEMSNEALSGTGTIADGSYGDSIQRLTDLRATYEIIRKAAPDTHVMVLTPSGVSGWGYVDGMARLTRKFEGLGPPIDWTKTSVAYHLYHADVNLFPLAENLRNFHSQYPGWPSENNFPSTVTNEQLGITDTWRAVSYGTDVFINQTCERLGLGWSHWNINRLDQLNRNWPILWEDAVTRGYSWQPDPVVNTIAAMNAGGAPTGIYAADINYFGGDIASNNLTGPVDTSGVKNAGPANLYRTERWGNFTYGFGRLAANRSYRVRLHFTEGWTGITGAGQRVFNVYANGVLSLNKFDIFLASGLKKNRVVVRDLAVRSDSKGRISVRFESVVQNAKVDGVELLPLKTMVTGP